MSKLYNYTADQPGLEVGVPPVQPDHAGYQAPYYESASKEAGYVGQPASTPPPRICGLPKRTFWIAFALGLLVVGAALGGGLGGGLAASHKTAHVPSSSSSSTGTPQQQQSTSSSATTSTSTSSLSAPTATISPFSTSPGTYRIINIYTNTAIDLLNGGTTSGTQIEAWVYDPYGTPASYVHQAWLISAVSNNAVTIFNTASSQYLTAPSGLISGQNPSDSSLAQIYGGGPGNPGESHTQFNIVKNSDNSISFQSVAYQTKLLDVANFGTTNGTPIVVWEPNGGGNQKWRLLAS